MTTGQQDDAQFAARLSAYVRARRWFRAKTREVRGARIVDRVPLGEGAASADNVLVLLELAYPSGAPDLYAVPLATVDGATFASLAAESPHAVVDADRRLVDGLVSGGGAAALFDLALQGGTRRGEHGLLRGETTPLFARHVGNPPPPPKHSAAEQTNSAAFFGDRALMKIYRQLDDGPSPEIEIGEYLTRACESSCVPRVLGALRYQAEDGASHALAIVQELIANQGDAWSLALRELDGMFGRAAGPPPVDAVAESGGEGLLAAVDAPPLSKTAPDAARVLGRFVSLAEKLAHRTAEMHLALAGAPKDDPDFAPELLSPAARRAAATRANEMFDVALTALMKATAPAARGHDIGDEARRLGTAVLAPAGRSRVKWLLDRLSDQPLDALRTRTHGDLHLGQVLAVARGGAGADVDDFVIIDFEGEPARPLAERRAKGSPLRDVMGMVRSFDYAPEAALRARAAAPGGAGERARLAGWARLWTAEVTAAYLRADLRATAGAPFIPSARDQLARLLTFHELEKVVYEIGYELDNRPAWVEIPLRGLVAIAGLGPEETHRE